MYRSSKILSGSFPKGSNNTLSKGNIGTELGKLSEFTSNSFFIYHPLLKHHTR